MNKEVVMDIIWIVMLILSILYLFAKFLKGGKYENDDEQYLDNIEETYSELKNNDKLNK